MSELSKNEVGEEKIRNQILPTPDSMKEGKEKLSRTRFNPNFEKWVKNGAPSYQEQAKNSDKFQENKKKKNETDNGHNEEGPFIRGSKGEKTLAD